MGCKSRVNQLCRISQLLFCIAVKTRYLKFSKVSRIRFRTCLMTTVFTVLKETKMSVTPEGAINVIST